MMDYLRLFLHMGGYAYYVWPAYLSVLTWLSVQWFLPWRRWRHHLQQSKTHE